MENFGAPGPVIRRQRRDGSAIDAQIDMAQHRGHVLVQTGQHAFDNSKALCVADDEEPSRLAHFLSIDDSQKCANICA